MKWFVDLFNGQTTVVNAILVYALVAASGVALGKLAFKGISLGIACVLFTGILFGYLGFSIEKEILEFIREFGLILFVYTMGLQVGPGFFASLRREGLKLNFLAVLCVLLSLGVVVILYFSSRIPIATLVGLMSGAVTNTPGLGAAQQTIQDLSVLHPSLGSLPPLGTYYALAYPGGVIGIILVMILAKWLLKINLEQESHALFQRNQERRTPLSTITLEVQNPSLIGKPVKSLFETLQAPFVVSRICHENQVRPATKETVLHQQDVILVVARQGDFDRLRTIVGRESSRTLTGNGSLVARQLRITRPEVCHRPLSELNTIQDFGVTLTRVARSGVEFIPNGGTRLQFGDIVTAIGEEGNVVQLTGCFGNSDKKLEEPHLASLFLGIALGVIAGSIPFAFPGIPAPVRLGLAGGPLIVAILISRYAPLLPFTSYVTQSANYMVREIGIVLFLASVGLRAGPDFFRTLLSEQGAMLLLFGALITFIPLVLTALVARLAYRMNFLEIFGLLAGACTDPPALSFATQMAGTDAPAVAYAGVYPLTMFLRVLAPQLLLLLLL